MLGLQGVEWESAPYELVCNNPLISKVMEEILLQAYTTSDNHDFVPSLDFDLFYWILW
jgi:hypothetical protein